MVPIRHSYYYSLQWECETQTTKTMGDSLICQGSNHNLDAMKVDKV